MKFRILLILIELAVVFGALYEIKRRALEEISQS